MIENENFENLIQVYDRPKALFYYDPPYHKTENYYDAVFTESAHEHLKNILSAIKGRFILSYNDDKHIHKLYHDFDIISVECSNNLEKASYKELIIKNF